MRVPETLSAAGLRDQHYTALGAAISEGYAALQSLSGSNPMLGNAFLPGHRVVGHLRNVAVQHALSLKAKTTKLFATDVGWNAIGNYAYLTLKHRKLQLTAHYLGPRGTRGIRKAIYRSELQCRNGDLFESEAKVPDAHYDGEVYAQIVHGGLDKPVLAAIRIPNRDYMSRKIDGLSLVVGEPSASAVENVKDRIAETMKKRRKGKTDDREAS